VPGLTVVSVISDVRGKGERKLRTLLEKLGRNLGCSKTIQFNRMQTVHYAAWLILPGVNNGPARLLFETNYVGTPDAHLADLIRYGGKAFDHIYAYCAGYRAKKVPGEGIRDYFQNLSSVFYVALPDRPLADIRNAICVYEQATAFLDTLATKGMAKEEVDARLIAYFQAQPPAKRPQKFDVTQRGQMWRLALHIVVAALLYLLPGGALFYFKFHKTAIAWLVLPFLYLIVIVLAGRVQELIEESRPQPSDPSYGPEEFRQLNVGPQNHLCTLATIRPGWFRRYLLKQALLLGTVLSRYFFILGKLDLMPTIHFARWILMGDELIFLSNYDGSFSSYLADFSDQAWGVNLVWGNTIGFPPTRFLTRDGANDLDAFEAQGLSHFHPAQVFYSAYPEYPVQNLIRYLEFRDALQRAL